MEDAKIVDGGRSTNTSIKVLFDDSKPWIIRLTPFITQVDGHNCGAIACLKLMEIYNVITLDDIKESLKSYRTLVFDHHSRMIDDLSHELIVTKRARREAIKQEDIICMCWRPKHTSIKKTVQDCCKYSFHSDCLVKYLTYFRACPYCNDMTTTSPTSRTEGNIAAGMDIASDVSICKEIYTTKDPSNTPNTAMMDTDHPQQSKNDALREESVKKRRLLQDKQAEKMKKRHAESLQQLGKEVRVGSIVTLHVDSRVASHARGITAVVVNCNNNSGGIIACTSAGIVVNGMAKKEWWIAADMYQLRTAPGELYTSITPELADIQRQIIEGRFDSSTHPKCNIGDAHAYVVGASSPCKRNNCGCKDGKCTKRCGCFRNKVSCTSTCSCSGNCPINPKNHNNVDGNVDIK